MGKRPEKCPCGLKSSDPRLPQGSLLASVTADSGGMGLGHTEQGLGFRLIQCEGLSCHSRSKEDVVPEGWLLRRVAHVQ